MKELNRPIPPISYIDLHRAVVNSKKNKINGVPNPTKINLLRLDRKVSSRYKAFELAIQNNDLFNFCENRILLQSKNDLLSCYTGRTKPVQEIFNLIRTAQHPRFLKRCPYCGITLPKTYDHYLPEAKFPELAVHALNLIPCCGTCNQTKNDNWKDSTHRTFINFYTDSIPIHIFLHVQLHSPLSRNSVGATFSLRRPTNIPNDTWDIISSHYNKLGLINNYNENVNDEISEILNTCVCHIKEGGTNITNFIIRLKVCEEALYGPNHWRVVLMNALAYSRIFLKIVADNT